MTEKTRIVVIGATSVIAEHCCRLWVQRGPIDLLLVARDAARTERIAADLRVRGAGSTVTVMTADFVDPQGELIPILKLIHVTGAHVNPGERVLRGKNYILDPIALVVKR